jgi:hypothetical protein
MLIGFAGQHTDLPIVTQLEQAGPGMSQSKLQARPRRYGRCSAGLSPRDETRDEI